MLTFFRICIYFTVFSFVGWISETIICSFDAKKFVKRGFLSGPFIPVYGFGGLLITVCLEPFMGHPAVLYIAGVIAVTILEYCTAWLMETIFSVKLWDYSQHKYNYKGRVWLVSSLFFGVLGLLGSYVILPPISRLVDRIPETALIVLGSALMVYFMLDTINSTVALLGIKAKLQELSEQFEVYRAEYEEVHKMKQEYKEKERKEAYEFLKIYLEDKKNGFSEKMNDLMDKTSTGGKTSSVQRRLFGAYPNMSSKKYRSSVQAFRDSIDAYYQKRKKHREEKKADKKKRK